AAVLVELDGRLDRALDSRVEIISAIEVLADSSDHFAESRHYCPPKESANPGQGLRHRRGIDPADTRILPDPAPALQCAPAHADWRFGGVSCRGLPPDMRVLALDADLGRS